MKLNWNFLGDEGCKTKTFCWGGGGGYLCNYTNYEAASVIPLGEESVRTAKLRIL